MSRGEMVKNIYIEKNGWKMHERWVENESMVENGWKLMGEMFQLCKNNIECDH